MITRARRGDRDQDHLGRPSAPTGLTAATKITHERCCCKECAEVTYDEFLQRQHWYKKKIPSSGP
jgi:hypothetical protein